MKCPRCGKEADNTMNPFRPFCSERCKIIDLGNWVSGAYRIANENPSEEENGDAIQQKDSEKK